MNKLFLPLILLAFMACVRVDGQSVSTPTTGGGGGSGTVNTGTTPQLGYYATTGTAISPTGVNLTWTSPTLFLGVDNTTGGLLQISNGSANAHTIFGSGATTTNTILGFAAVPTTGHLLDCTVATTTCTLHDSGVVTANVVNASSPGVGLAHFAGSTQTVTSSSVVGGDIASSVALAGSPTTTTQSQNDNSTKLATTAYTDLAVANAVAGVNPAVAVLAASTASLTGTYSNGVAGIGATFTVTATGVFTLDGITINTIGQRVLLKNQSSGFQNGVYTATIVGAVAVQPVFTRALDYDTPSDINSTGAIPVQSGTVNTTTSWLLTSTVTTVGTDALTYTQFSYTPSTVVVNNAANAGTAAMTLDMSAATGATAFKVPVIAGATAGADGVIDYDSTAKITHVRTNGADSLAAATTATSTTVTNVLHATAVAGVYTASALVAADIPATPLVTPGTSPTLTGPRGYAVCTGTCTVTVPVPVAGYEFCIMNDDNVSTAITLSALGSSAMYENSARTAYGTAGTGTLVVAAAAANKVCIVARDATHYFTVSNAGGAITVN